MNLNCFLLKISSLFGLVVCCHYVIIALSIHLETYVDNFDPFSGLKLFTPFIKPIVPIDNKSSWSIFVFEYFLHT